MNELKKYKKQLVLFFIYYLTMMLSYIFAVSKRYSYQKLSMDINVYKLIFALICLLITVYLLPRNEKPSSKLILLLYLVLYVPLSCYFWLNDKAISYFIAVNLCFVIIEVALSMPSRRVSFKLPNPEIIIKLLFFFYLAVAMTLFLINGGISAKTLSFTTIYEQRQQNVTGGMLGYMLNWCAKSLTPLFFAYYLNQKAWKRVALVCIIQALLYLSFGFKSFLLSIPLMMLISYAIKRNSFQNSLLYLLIGGNVVATIFFSLGISILPMNLYSYRTMYIPALTQYNYFEFFQSNSFLHMSEGSIGKLFGISYPYDQPIGVIVDKFAFGPQWESNGNTGIFGYGYADFGYLGMILAAVVLVLVLRYLDNHTSNVPIYIVVGALSYPFILLNDVNIMIALNTGGILISLVLLSIMNNINWENNVQGMST